MNRLQQAGGVAAMLSALLVVANVVVVFGLIGPAAVSDPAQILGLAQAQPAALLAIELFKIGSAALALVVVLALHQRLSSGSVPIVQLASIAGIIGAALYLASGVVGYTLLSRAPAISAAAGGDGVAVFVAANALTNALGYAAIFANGWWSGLVGVAALSRGGLPRLLSIVGVLLGAASLFVFVLLPLALIVLMLGIVWSLWLGAVLVRRGPAGQPQVASHSGTMPV